MSMHEHRNSASPSTFNWDAYTFEHKAENFVTMETRNRLDIERYKQYFVSERNLSDARFFYTALVNLKCTDIPVHYLFSAEKLAQTPEGRPLNAIVSKIGAVHNYLADMIVENKEALESYKAWFETQENKGATFLAVHATAQSVHQDVGFAYICYCYTVDIIGYSSYCNVIAKSRAGVVHEFGQLKTIIESMVRL